MEVEIKPRTVRILTGHPDVVEDQIAALGNDYTVTHWHFWAFENVGFVTCVLLHGSIIRQMQIAMAAANGPPRR